MMYIASVRLHCSKCKEIFDGEVVNNAPFAVAIASMRALWCPKCGAQDIAFVLDEDRLREELGSAQDGQ
jgi:Zn finger protein HypA/HybF involved in hydrogenase expression